MKLIYIVILFIFLASAIQPQSFIVTNISPSPHSLTAAPTDEINIGFNLPVDAASISDSSFMVWGRWSGAGDGNIQFNSDSTLITFIPVKNFFYGEMITVSLSKNLKSKSSDNLTTAFTFNFWIKTLPGTMDLTKISTIEVRQPGEGWIQTYGTYAGDLDEDGWSDFVVPNERSNDLRVFMNDGSGSYNDFTIYPIPGGSRPSTNAGFDYNLDGDIDFVVGNSTSNTVSLFEGHGTGNITWSANYFADQQVRGLSLADVDGNGFMDVITANRNGSNISIIINNGDGTFSSVSNFDANCSGETACATADVNGDGILDLYVGGNFSNEVVLLLGDGFGGFTFQSKVTAGNSPWMIASGDVNNDGIPDVVSANSGSSNFSVILSDNNGNLSSPVNYPVGNFSLAIDLGDIDGDGDLDVVVSNYSSADFTLYENDGTGNFINPRTLLASTAGSCAVLHDRDNDGDMDMTGIDEMDDLLILFENDIASGLSDDESIPEEFVLYQNYPNPFNPSTKICWQSPVGGHQSLKVYDVLGNEVATLVNKYKPAGSYEVEFNPEAGIKHPASGIYFYKLQAGDFVETKKMIYLK